MSSKREKELARAKWERQQIRRTQRAQRDTAIKRGAVVAVAVLAVVALIISNRSTSAPTATPLQTSTPSMSQNSSGTGGCRQTSALSTQKMTYNTAPSAPNNAHTLNLGTNCGSIQIALDPKAPKTTTIMSNLAKAKYFDMTTCHRLTTSGYFVLQCGDRTATGTGSPGFTFADENLPTVTASNSTFTYASGTVAMANSGPNTNGSQFFIVYRNSPLPPNYSIWGHVVRGLDVVTRIASAGVSGGGIDGKPNANVVIERAVAQ